MGLVMPSNSLFGFGIQQGAGATDLDKMLAGYEEVVSASDINYYQLTGMNMAPVKNVDQLPDETGGRALPAGAFTTGVWGEGGASIISRLSNRLGWVLLAMTGSVSTVSDIKAEDLTICGGDGVQDCSGVNCHIFRFESSDQFFAPWLTIHRLLPHHLTAERVGEIFQDGRIRTGTITAAAGQPVTSDMDLVARLKQSNYVFNIDPETNLSWAATFDNMKHFAVGSCDGHFKVESVDYRARNIALTFTNRLLAPAQSLTIGTVHPIDFPTLARTVQVTVTFLVDNYDLYLSTFSGAAVDASASSGENATCVVYHADLDMMLASQTAIGAAGDTDEPYRLRVVSSSDDDNVTWQIRPLQIQPGRPVELQATGNFQSVDTGDPVYVILQNAQANYALP